MTVAIYTISSSLHRELMPDASTEPFIRDIEKACGFEFLFRGDDFRDWGTHGCDLLYVRTGGTEGLFRQLGLTGEIKLLTSGRSNSLAASMEILSYLRSNGDRGEILHGSPEYIASRIHGGFPENGKPGPEGKTFIRPLPPLDLGGARLGVIGKPSDWLISSDVDYSKAAEMLNVQLMDISMSELLDEVMTSSADLRTFEGSLAIYDALKVLIARYHLDGLTIRCFDLLDTVHNTGCLALARLNSEGIPSSCEGDVPALLTMMAAYRLTGCPGFQCNLSRVDGDELLFAHCTVPLSMVRSYTYATHFESGIGTAIKGEIPEGPVTIFKISPDMNHYVSIPGEILRNQSEKDLCRTQIIVRAPGAGGYFLNETLANHHVVVPGECLFQNRA